MTPCEALLTAASFIQQRGWCQGRFTRGDGALCALGALQKATIFDPNAKHAASAYTAATELLSRHLGFKDGDVGCSVPGWNDDPERTKEEVVAALQSAAK